MQEHFSGRATAVMDGHRIELTLSAQVSQFHRFAIGVRNDALATATAKQISQKKLVN